MIDEKHIREINTLNKRKLFMSVIPYIIFAAVIIISYCLRFEYSEETSLFNDKLIDVSSIFFGIFIGCLYLFEKFKNNNTYSDFLKFCKKLLFQNLILIAFSFLIILINNRIKCEYIYNEYIIYPRTLLFSSYIALFAVTLFNMLRFIRIILKILASNK